MQIILPEAYLSWPSLGKPAINSFNPNEPPRYKATFIFPKGTDLSELLGKIGELKEEMKTEPQHVCLKACSSQIDEDTGLVKALYDKGDYFLNAWNSEDRPPVLCGPDRKPGYHPSNFKGGNKVQAIIDLWGSTKRIPCIGAGLMAVQWRGEGEPVGATVNLNMFSEASAPAISPADLGI